MSHKNTSSTRPNTRFYRTAGPKTPGIQTMTPVNTDLLTRVPSPMAISTNITPRTDPNLAPSSQTTQTYSAILAPKTTIPKKLTSTPVHQTSLPSYKTRMTDMMSMLTANLANLDPKTEHGFQQMLSQQQNPSNTTLSS